MRRRPRTSVERRAGSATAARTPIAGSASTVRPSVAGLDQEQHRLRRRAGADHEQLGVGAARDQRLHAVEHVAVAGAAWRWSPGSSTSKRTVGSVSASAAAADVVAGERRQVGLLLLVGPPQRRARWRPSRAPGWRRRGPGRPGRAPRRRGCRPSRSAPRRCRRATPGRPRIGSPISRPAVEHLVGRGAGRRRRRRPPGRTTSAANSVTTSTSICSSSVGVRSKTPLAGAAPGAGAGPPPLAGAGEGAAGGGRRAEPAAGDREDGLLGLLAQAEPVEERRSGRAGSGRRRRSRSGRGRLGWTTVPAAGRRPAGGGHAGNCNSELHVGYGVGTRVTAHTRWGAVWATACRPFTRVSA